MIDPFEQAFQDWLHGVQYEARTRREDANMTALVNTLQERGHRITYDYRNRYIFVDEKITITMHVAREERPETILRWIEDERT